MYTVTVRLYAELNEPRFPVPEERERSLRIRPGSTVGDCLGTSGVPVDLVDLVLLNGESSALERILADGDRLSIYPVFDSFDISDLVRLRTTPLRRPRFLLDVHLGKLAFHLRMLGFDTLYRNDYDDATLFEISLREARTLLSRDRTLVSHPALEKCFLVRSANPREQLKETIRRFDLAGAGRPFTRCLLCNAVLHAAEKKLVLERLPQKVRSAYEEFHQCPDCRRVYWKGSHYERMQVFIRELMRECEAEWSDDCEKLGSAGEESPGAGGAGAGCTGGSASRFPPSTCSGVIPHGGAIRPGKDPHAAGDNSR